MKVCSLCHRPKALAEFAVNRKRRDGHQSACKVCLRENSKKHYKENKLAYCVKNKRRKEHIREFLDGLKEGRPCADCGRTFPPCAMDFDHVRGVKNCCVSTMAKGKVSLKTVSREVAKCDLVCAVCHRIRTHARLAGVVQG